MTPNMNIHLLYFAGCPSWQSGMQNLHSALKANRLDVSVELIQVMDNDDVVRKKFLGCRHSESMALTCGIKNGICIR